MLFPRETIKAFKSLTKRSKCILGSLLVIYLVVVFCALRYEGFSLVISLIFTVFIVFIPMGIYSWLGEVKGKEKTTSAFTGDLIRELSLIMFSLIAAFCFLSVLNHFKEKNDVEKTIIELHKEVQTIRQILETSSKK